MAPTEYCLLIATSVCLESSAWAAWVQAFLAAVTIWGGLWIGRRQQLREWNHQRFERAETLAVVVRWARNVMKHIESAVDTYEGLRDVVEENVFLDRGELEKIEQLLAHYPVADLPGALALEVLTAHSTIRQFLANFRGGIEAAPSWEYEPYASWVDHNISAPRAAMDKVVAKVDELVKKLSI